MSSPPAEQNSRDNAAMEPTLAGDEEAVQQPVRKRRRVYGDKVCEVCGDKALAHHFGTLACETCKAFFRRNANSKEMKKCLFQGCCVVTIKTRRFCPACRLAKCFEMGMRAELILDEEEKKERREKAKVKQCKKEVQHSSMDSDSTYNTSVCSVTTTGQDPMLGMEMRDGTVPELPQSSMDQQAWHSMGDMTSGVVTNFPVDPALGEGVWGQTDMVRVKNMVAASMAGNGRSVGMPMEVIISNPNTMAEETRTMLYTSRDTLVPTHAIDLSAPLTPATPSVPYPPDHWQPQHQPTPPPMPQTPAPQQIHPPEPAGSTSSPVAQSYNIPPFQHVPRDALPSDPYMYWRLSEEERCLLTQLSSAYQDTLLSILQGSPPREFVSRESVTVEMYLQECEREARNAVYFAKRMEDFRQLRTDEQIALLKASTNQALGIRGCSLYVVEKNAWLTHLGYITLDHFMKLVPNHPHRDVAVSYCRNLKSIVKNDVTLYALLHCIILFDPSDERVIDRQMVNSIRDKYIILLRHYLQSVYSYSHSEKYMIALQESLSFGRDLCQEGKSLFKKFFPSVPNKLLVELLDLD